MGAMDGANDASFGAAVGADVGDVDQHEVSVHGVADEVRGNEDVPGELGLEGRAQRLGVGNDEAEAVAVHGEASSDEILVGGGLREGVAVGVDGDECAAGDELLQMLIEFAAFLAVQAEFADELLESGLALGLAGDVFEDGGVGEHAS